MEWEGRVVSAHHKLAVDRAADELEIGEPEQWKRYDSEFHQALISNCGSRTLMEAHAAVFDKYFRYQMIALNYRGERARAPASGAARGRAEARRRTAAETLRPMSAIASSMRWRRRVEVGRFRSFAVIQTPTSKITACTAKQPPPSSIGCRSVMDGEWAQRPRGCAVILFQLCRVPS